MCSSNKKGIRHIFSRMIFDAKGYPAVEVDLITELGLFRASSPAAHTVKGEFEMKEVRDEVADSFHGKGVSNCVANINDILAPELMKKEFDVTQQREIDEFIVQLDGTPFLTRFGTNGILAVSMVVCKAGAAKRGLPLYKHIADLADNKVLIIPVPILTVISGGTDAANKLAEQEFSLMPTGATSFGEAMKMATETYHHLRNVISKKYGATSVNTTDEGSFAPNVGMAKEALQLIKDAIGKAGYTGRIDVAIDAAAQNMYKPKEKMYNLDFKSPKPDKKKMIKPDKMIDSYSTAVKNFSVVSIEDPYQIEDWKLYANLTDKFDIQVVGDFLLQSNPVRIQKAIDEKACNTLCLKLDAAGTVTRAITAHLLAKENGWGTIVCHRLGETEDTFIADFVVGIGAGQIKAGPPNRVERNVKYNQILRIEEEVGSMVRYAGKAFRKPY